MWLRDCLLALEKIHSLDLCHKRIDASSFSFDSYGTLKLGGIIEQRVSTHESLLSTLAPEQQGKEDSLQQYACKLFTEKVDIFCLASLFHGLCMVYLIPLGEEAIGCESGSFVAGGHS